MSLLAFLKRKRGTFPLNAKSDRGFLVFANTSEVIRAENLLKAEVWGIRVMGPPPEVRCGCDLEGGAGLSFRKMKSRASVL
jgi:hypothetical protein